MTIVDSDRHGLAAGCGNQTATSRPLHWVINFARGVADGSLPADCFKAYVAQDAFILEAFARAYALALARSPDRHGLETFRALSHYWRPGRASPARQLHAGGWTRHASSRHLGLHRFPAGNGQPRLRRREVRGVDVLRMFRNRHPPIAAKSGSHRAAGRGASLIR